MISTESSESGGTAIRRPRRLIIGVAVIVVLFIAQSAAIVVQQQQIDDLQSRAQLQGPQGAPGPVGPPGPAGPRGATGPVGKDGRDAVNLSVPDTGGSNARVAPATETEARAHCQETASKAYPDSDDPDPTLDQLGDAYTATMRQKSFDQCMSDEGYPQETG